MKKITGKVSKFGHKGYGFIDGSDGEKYFAHQKNIIGGSRLRVGSKVEFEPQDSDKGKVAGNITLKDKAANKTNTSNTTSGITTLFTISFVLHAITLYWIFLK